MSRRIATGVFVLGLVALLWYIAAASVGWFLEATDDRLLVVLWGFAAAVAIISAIVSTLLVAYVLGEASERSRDAAR